MADSAAPLRTLHLNASIGTPGHGKQAWRLPHVDPLAFLDIDYYARLAAIADESGLDAVFAGDGQALRGDIRRGPATGFDPLVLFTYLAAVTRHVGFISTSSTTYNHPYNVARRYNNLDHLSRGRAAVNFVTTYTPAVAANFGPDSHPDKATRYRRAHEFLDVVTKLWDAWGPDALRPDKATGTFGDAEKVRPIDHAGEFFSVAGPLSVPSSPQGRPVIVQAGASEGGLRLAGDYAELVFAAAHTQARAIELGNDIRARAAAAGRDPESVKISLGVIVLVAATTAEARRREQELHDLAPIEQEVAALAKSLGLRRQVKPDEVIHLEDLPADPVAEAGSVGFQESIRALIGSGEFTATEIVFRSAGGQGHRLVVGSAEQVADDLEEWFRAGAADGFTVMSADTAVDFENFNRLVIPILRRRGLFHEGPPAPTLRERYGLPMPAGLLARA